MSKPRRVRYGGIGARMVIIAIAVLLTSVTPVPRSLIDTLRWADTARASQSYSAAANAYLSAYQYQPWVTNHLAAAAEMRLRAGNYDVSEQYLDELSQLRPLRPDEVVWLGSIYAGKGQIDQAITLWEAGRSQGATDTESMSQLAEIYIARKDWLQATQILHALTNQAPDDANLFYQLGLIQSLDQPEWAAVALNQAVMLNPALDEKLLPLRAFLVNNNDDAPDLRYAQLGVTYLTMHELALADEALSRAVAINPAYGEALAYLALVRALQNEPALAASQQALALQPDNTTVLYLTGMTWKEYAQPDKARAMFERANSLDALNPAFAAEIANTYQEESAYEWAELWMDEAVRLAGDDVRFHILRVQFYVDENYKIEEKGLPLAQTLVQQYPENALAHDALGWAYFLMGEVDQSQSALEQAVLLDPNAGRIHYHLGRLYELKGASASAITHYQQAAALDVGGKFGLLAQRALERFGN